MKDFAAELGRRSAEPRLLVRCPNWVGDAVMALPALEAVRRSAPAAHLAVLAKPWTAEVAAMSGLADEVIIYRDPGEHRGPAGKLRLARLLASGGFHAAVLLQNAFEAALLAAASRIPLRGGYDTDWRRRLLTHPVAAPGSRGGRWPEGHLTGHYLGLVRALGFDARVDEVPALRGVVPSASLEARVALCPGASYGPAKMWPAARYVELGRRLAAAGMRLAVLGSVSEAGVCREVASGIGPAAVDLSGRTTLGEAAGILAAAAVAVSNDSGLLHLAAAVGTPVVGLYGSTDPAATGPLSTRSLVLQGGAPCAPCFRRTCPRKLECFDPITVKMVEAACLEAMAGGGARD